jgi:ribonuclease-3
LPFFNPFYRFINRFVKKDKAMVGALSRIIGSTPHNVSLYQLALTPSGSQRNNGGRHESNERLEFLGDAILGSVIADYLFRKYPYKDEGFLTEVRSRLVNREALNMVAMKLGLQKLIKADAGVASRQRFLYGNALEALVGAVYLDKGYEPTRQFIQHKIIRPFFDLTEIINTTTNHKSKLIEWAQSTGKSVRFDTVDQKLSGPVSEFTVQVLVNEEAIATGNGFTKKKAEQAAAEKAMAVLQPVSAA